MAKNAIIITHFGSNQERIKLLCETVERLRAQHGNNVIYIIENALPHQNTLLPRNILNKVRYKRVAGNPTLWQKEAMYNAGAKVALEEGCANLIFTDSDIVPDSTYWLAQIETDLENYDWVHCAQEIPYLKAQPTESIIKDPNKGFIDKRYLEKTNWQFITYSFVYILRNPIRPRGFPGGVWAVNRSTWMKYKSWDVTNIVGGGDYLHLLRLFRMQEPDNHKDYGNIRALLFNSLLEKYHREDPLWRVGVLDSVAYHLHHGDVGKRDYTLRYRCFIKPNIEIPQDLKFKREELIDFKRDIFINPDGLVELNENEVNFRWFLLKFTEYFLSREDADIDTVNKYLEFVSSNFRLTKRRGYLEVIQVDKKSAFKTQKESLDKKIEVDEKIIQILDEYEAQMDRRVSRVIDDILDEHDRMIETVIERVLNDET